MNEPVSAEARTPVGRDILEQVRARSEPALNVFFSHYFDRVYAYAVRLLQDRSLAEDVVQEAFLRMHNAIEQLDPSRDPTGWVFTIVTNTARDYWRSRAHRAAQRHVDIEDAWEIASDSPESNPEHRVEQRERGTLIDRALSRLSPADRELLLLREYEGLSSSEIAAQLQVTPEVVRQRYSRALRRLARDFADRKGEGA